MPLRAPVSTTTDDNAPIVNGHSDPDPTTTTLLEISTALAARVNVFLETEQDLPLLKRVQEQTRVALGVIDEALERYRCVKSMSQAQLCTKWGVWNIFKGKKEETS